VYSVIGSETSLISNPSSFSSSIISRIAVLISSSSPSAKYSFGIPILGFLSFNNDDK
jgi:hypothetical protein